MPSTRRKPVSSRARETRARLLAAGRHAFARKPFAAVHLKKDILEAAGISVGSFYHQFNDKGELLAEIVNDHSAGLRDRFSAIHHDGVERTPDQIARASYSLLFDMVDESPELMAIRVRNDGIDPEVGRFLAKDAARWNESRVADYERLVDAYGFDINSEAAAELVGLLADGALRRYLAIPQAERPAARERLLTGLVRFTLEGIRGLSRLETNTN